MRKVKITSHRPDSKKCGEDEIQTISLRYGRHTNKNVSHKRDMSSLTKYKHTCSNLSKVYFSHCVQLIQAPDD